MATSGVGAELLREDTPGGGVYSAIANVKSISGPAMSRETIDTTTLDTSGGYRTFIASFRDAGTVSASMLFDKTGYDLLKADFESDTAVAYQIKLPDADQTQFDFDALVTELPLNVTVDDAISNDVTFKISGEVTVSVYT